MHNEVIYLKKGTALTLTGAILVGALAIPSYENAHAVNKRTSIEQVIDKAADAKNIPGVIVTVKNGEASWAYASGEGNIERNHKVDADSAFRIGSTTKTFVATVVLQLAGEKKLSLDDTVEKWLPGLIKGKAMMAAKLRFANY